MYVRKPKMYKKSKNLYNNIKQYRNNLKIKYTKTQYMAWQKHDNSMYTHSSRERPERGAMEDWKGMEEGWLKIKQKNITVFTIWRQKLNCFCLRIERRRAVIGGKLGNTHPWLVGIDLYFKYGGDRRTRRKDPSEWGNFL